MPRTQAFSSQITVNHDDTQYRAEFFKYSPEVYRIELTSPDTINGMVISGSGEDHTVEFPGLEGGATVGALPVGSFSRVLCNVLDRLSDASDIDISSQRDLICFSGAENGYKFYFKTDRQLIPKSLSVPQINLEISFTNIKYL